MFNSASRGDRLGMARCRGFASGWRGQEIALWAHGFYDRYVVHTYVSMSSVYVCTVCTVCTLNQTGNVPTLPTER